MLNPSLSIIIIAHNNPSIFDCIEHLKRQIDEYDEIILVDDHSTEGYFISVKDYCNINNIVLLQSTKRGNRASNRNLGASKAQNPILLFVDADMLLFQTSIPAIKKAYLTQEHIGYIGTRCAARYDPLRMKILDGVNIEDILDKNENTLFLSELPSIKDKRITSTIYINGLPEQKFYWIYYYSCCCTVLKEVFDKIGGFDETFIGWGVEDIDLGYRISLNGSLSFLRGFTGIHVPHNRNVLYAEQDNCNNLKQMLKKSLRYDVEVTSVYRVSANILEKIRAFMNQMRMLNLPELKPTQTNDTLYVNAVSLNCPNGKLIYYDRGGNHTNYEMIGVSTFFANKSISTVIVSKNIVLYPISMICGILQECIRIGCNVYLEGDEVNHRLDWSDFPNLSLLQPQKRNEYRIHDLMEINFKKDEKNNRYIVTSDYLDLEISKTVPTKISYPKKDLSSLISKTYCVINITNGTGYKVLLNQLKSDFQLNYVGIYDISCDGEVINIDNIPEYLYPLLVLKTNILFVVNDIENFDFDSIVGRKNKGDIFVDCKGKIKII